MGQSAAALVHRAASAYRTPVNSILFVGLVAMAFGAAGIAGVGEQEAFQLLENAAGIFYGLTYLVMFAIPLVGLRERRAAAAAAGCASRRRRASP